MTKYKPDYGTHSIPEDSIDGQMAMETTACMQTHAIYKLHYHRLCSMNIYDNISNKNRYWKIFDISRKSKYLYKWMVVV